jgi:hypothetical protein
MPLLDVSFVTQDPMLSDVFAVQRRDDVVGENGRTLPTVYQTFTRVRGVITFQSPGDLLRRDDSQSVPNRIFIATKFKIRKASVENGRSYQPDLITWDGIVYTVEEVMPYHRYGKGVYEVIASSQNAMDRPQ